MSWGRRSRRIFTASAIFWASGCFTEPKFENESIATRGTWPKFATSPLAEMAICASCSAVGSMFTVVSPQNITCFSKTSM